MKQRQVYIIGGLLLLSVAGSFWMLSARTLDSHECFVSVTAREMAVDGHWIVPTLNGEPRLNKTPLPYWLVAGFSKLTGTVDEFTSRFPSAFFAVLSAAVVFYFVNQWLSFRTALISTAVWITSLSYFRGSHSARPDLLLTFFVTVCFFSFYSAITAADRKKQVIFMIIFWVSFGLANLAKGPAPVAYVGIPIIAYIVMNKKWSIIPRLLPFWGIIITLAITLPWVLYIANYLNWDLLLWKREYIDRLSGEYGRGNYPFYYYFGIMFKYSAPWAAFLVIALIAAPNKAWKEKSNLVKYLWLIFVADFIFLTIDQGKRQHYIMPIMPSVLVLIGIMLEDIVFSRSVFDGIFAKKMLIGHLVVIVPAAIGGLIFIAIKIPQFLLGTSLIAAVILLAAFLSVIFFIRQKNALALAAVFTAVVLVNMISESAFTKFTDIDKGAKVFAQKIASIVPPSEKLVSYKHISSRFVQYFGRVVPEVNDKPLLYEHHDKGDWIIVTYDNIKDIGSDPNLRKVYSSERIAKRKEDTGGIIFHKSAAEVK